MFVLGTEHNLNSMFKYEYNRKSNCQYNVGDSVFYNKAPLWCKLICVQSGVTDVGTPDFSYISQKGEIVVDGTVKWKSDDLRFYESSGDIVGVAGEVVGKITWQYFLLENHLLLDGETLESFITDYADLYNVLEENNLIVDTQEKYNLNKVLWYYDSSMDIMTKPNFLDKTVWGGISVLEKKAGLPNITGGFRGSFYNVQVPFIEDMVNLNINKALRVERKTNTIASISISSTNALPTTSSAYNNTGFDITLNASRSNSIYGNSETVQPNAVQLLPQIRYKR